MARRRTGFKPISWPMMVISSTHICVTRPQWVKVCHHLPHFTATIWLSLQCILVNRLIQSFGHMLVHLGGMTPNHDTIFSNTHFKMHRRSHLHIASFTASRLQILSLHWRSTSFAHFNVWNKQFVKIYFRQGWWLNIKCQMEYKVLCYKKMPVCMFCVKFRAKARQNKHWGKSTNHTLVSSFNNSLWQCHLTSMLYVLSSRKHMSSQCQPFLLVNVIFVLPNPTHITLPETKQGLVI